MDPTTSLYEFGNSTAIPQESFSMKFKFPSFDLQEAYAEVAGQEAWRRQITFSEQISCPVAIGQSINFLSTWCVVIRCSDSHARVALKFQDCFKDATTGVPNNNDTVAILKFRIHIIDKDDDVVLARQWQSWENPRKIRLTQEYTMSDFISLDELFDNQNFLVPNNLMWIRCEGTLYGCPRNQPVSLGKYLTLPKVLRAGLSENNAFTDVQLAAQTGKCFKAHKIILSNASVTLRSLLSTVNNAEPNKLPSLCLEDLGEIEIKMMLEYIYTGKIAEQDWSDYQQAERLILLAKNYELPGLKWLCFNNLVATITLSSFPEIVKLFQRNKGGLTVRAILNQFCIRNQDKLIQLESFKKFASDNKEAFLYVVLPAVNREDHSL